MHQRNCRIVNDLNEELIADLQDQFIDDSSDTILNDFENSTTPSVEAFPTLKKGINLPKHDSEWSTANDYFKIALQSFTPITSQNINTNIRQLNETIYNYFSDTYGYTKSALNNHFTEKYKEKTAKELKKSLKMLKKNQTTTLMKSNTYHVYCVTNFVMDATTTPINHSKITINI